MKMTMCMLHSRLGPMCPLLRGSMHYRIERVGLFGGGVMRMPLSGEPGCVGFLMARGRDGVCELTTQQGGCHRVQGTDCLVLQKSLGTRIDDVEIPPKETNMSDILHIALGIIAVSTVA